MTGAKELLIRLFKFKGVTLVDEGQEVFGFCRRVFGEENPGGFSEERSDLKLEERGISSRRPATRRFAPVSAVATA